MTNISTTNACSVLSDFFVTSIHTQRHIIIYLISLEGEGMYVYVCISTCVSKCFCVYVCVCVCVYIYIYMNIDMCIYMHNFY